MSHNRLKPSGKGLYVHKQWRESFPLNNSYGVKETLTKWPNEQAGVQCVTLTQFIYFVSTSQEIV